MQLRRLAVALAGVVPLAGCVTFYSKTEIVGGYTRTAVSFESGDVSQKFQAAVKRMDTQAGSIWLGVPFITIYSKDERLSEAAAWNEAVRRCDTNADGVITADEVTAFTKSLDH
jgi:hypothetical protein